MEVTDISEGDNFIPRRHKQDKTTDSTLGICYSLPLPFKTKSSCFVGEDEICLSLLEKNKQEKYYHVHVLSPSV